MSSTFRTSISAIGTVVALWSNAAAAQPATAQPAQVRARRATTDSADRFVAAEMARFPDDSLTVIVLTNADGAAPLEIVSGLARIYFANPGRAR